MIHIKKGTEPPSLIKHKQQIGANFDNAPKDDIRVALLKEQGFLCAFCMGRIRVDKMKIEHWLPQNPYEELSLDYRNMLGVCLGHIDLKNEASETTCDTHKGNSLIKVNPLQERTVEKIKYDERTGRIYSENEEINRDLEQTLNLNAKLLQKNRKDVLEICKKRLYKEMKDGTWTQSLLKSEFQKYSTTNANGEKIPYSGIVLWYLKKRIAKG